jgi:hypothetical protein
MSSVIVQPQVANIMNAVMCGLMSFGLLMTPQKFMQGGQYQQPWFSNIPENRDNRVFHISQFMGFLMLGGCVVPTLINPNSQFLCYQMAIIHGINLVHSLVFMCSNAYQNAKPTQMSSKAQWYFMSVVSLIWFVVTCLACVHSTPNVVDSRETYISKAVANTVMVAFSSVFGVLFVLIPRHMLSTFWVDEGQEGGPSFMGFRLIDMTDLEYWWARCVGTTILGLNLGLLVDLNISQPLYTASSLVTISTLTLLNFHEVVMRQYKSISTKQVLMSWLPNLAMSGVVIGVLVSALLYV